LSQKLYGCVHKSVFVIKESMYLMTYSCCCYINFWNSISWTFTIYIITFQIKKLSMCAINCVVKCWTPYWQAVVA